MRQSIDTPLGPMVAYWNDQGLERLSFCEFEPSELGDTNQQGEIHLAESRDRDQIARECRLEASLHTYFQTGRLQFAIDDCDLSDVPAFHLKVLVACAAIPPGTTKTYGELAAAVGSPQAARAVGQAMAKNRWPLLIPCHRVVGHSGKLTGYSGRGGTATKRMLLDFEAGNLLWGLSEDSRIAPNAVIA